MVDAAADAALPVIGLCCSGGGYRATLSTMGSLTSLQQQGLFDSASYIAGLSGSTWAMAQIYSNEKHIRERRHEIDRLKEQLLRQQQAPPPSLVAPSAAFNPLLHSPVDLKRLSEELMSRVSQPLFSNVPLEFIKSCLVDKWSLFELEAQKAQGSTKSQPDVASTLSSDRRAAIESASEKIVAELAQAEQDGTLAAATDSLTLSSFATLLASVGLSDSFGWCLAHKLLQDPADLAAVASSPAAARLHHRHARLSDQASLLRRVSLPYPIYTAITFTAEQWEFTPDEVGLAASDVFVPSWSFGRTFDKGHALPTPPGQQEPNELSFGLLLACFASAFPTRIGRILEEVIYTSSNSASEPLLKYMHKVLHETLHLGQESAFKPAAVPNFLKCIEAAPEYAEKTKHIPRSLLDTPELTMMDAGLVFNLPFPPLLQPARGIDLIIACDASSPPEANACDAIRLAKEYADRHGLPFPRIDQSRQPLVTDGVSAAAASIASMDPSASAAAAVAAAGSPESLTRGSLIRASNAVVSVFEGDVARGVPTIIYLPLIANTKQMQHASSGAGGGACPPTAASKPTSQSGVSTASAPSAVASLPFDPRANFLSGGFCATLNFEYTPEQSQLLMELTYTNAHQARDVIRRELERIHNEKKSILARAATQRTV